VKKVIVLLSGGIDSSVAAAHLKAKNWKVLPLFINHHQGPLEAERQAASFVASLINIPKPLEIEVDLESMKELNYEWLNFGIGTPARNMVFVSLATMYAGIIDANAVALASPYGSTYADTSYAFLQSIEHTGRIALDRDIQIFSPFKTERWTSSEVVRQGARLGVPLDKTWSCALPRKVQCGKCIKCKGREERFKEANVKVKTSYSDKGVTKDQLDKALAFV
jgi:7-cyano-7-deazaguanine synthase